jgi:hypothetical protein
MRRSVYLNLLIKWSKAELSIAKSLQEQGLRSELTAVFQIPTEVKRFMLNCKIKETCRTHRLAMVVHLLQHSVAETAFKAKRWHTEYADLPFEMESYKKPVICLNFSYGIIKELIMKAQALQLYWDRIMTSFNNSALERELNALLDEDRLARS